MNPVHLPYEILLHISAFTGSSSLIQQLMLHRPFYEYYVTCRQYCIQLHTVITTDDEHTTYTVFGKLHREDGPASIYAGGGQYWYRYGKSHREDGPAIILACSAQFWCLNGLRHREDGPAVEDLRCSAPAIIHSDGAQYWFKNDKRHRENGPAIIYPSGTKKWYQNGLRHHGEKIGEQM